MQAFRVALEERNFRVLDLLIGLTQQMVEGELLQMETLGRPITEQEYNDLIYRKTACLFEVSMRLGSVLAQVNRSTPKQRWANTAARWAWPSRSSTTCSTSPPREEVLGKPVASDLREGKATLAVIHSLENGTATDREAIQTVLTDQNFDRVTHDEILAILTRNRLRRLRDEHRLPARREPHAPPSPTCPTPTSSAPCSGFRISSSLATSSKPSAKSSALPRSPMTHPQPSGCQSCESSSPAVDRRPGLRLEPALGRSPRHPHLPARKRAAHRTAPSRSPRC